MGVHFLQRHWHRIAPRRRAVGCLHVTLLDASVPTLDFAKRAAREAGVTKRIALKHGDAAQFANFLHAGSFDVILLPQYPGIC
jgi:predicted O-methyltransferase YrrM